jgi:hypothetical protein
MPRRPSLPAKPPVSLLNQQDTTGGPVPDDSAYQTLCKEEFTAYTAWLSFEVTNTSESKQQLRELRHTYEQKRNARSAYQSPLNEETAT